MNKVVTIKGVALGEGTPKICVPIVGRNIPEIIEEANFLKELDFDVLEWRVDFFQDVTDIDKVIETLKIVKGIISEKPVIFTFRSAKEGGQREVSREFYLELNIAVAESKLIEVIDVELFNDEADVKKIVKAAHDNEVRVIISNHDFHKTPSKEEIILRLRKAWELGGDIPKIAVMPNSAEDVITLLDATRIMKEQYSSGPIITMSMGGKGVISRISGELFGSALTFGSAKKASAPGQISVGDLRNVMDLMHNNI